MTNRRKGPSQTDETDVQGHAADADQVPAPDGAKRLRPGVEDDVEGHGMIQGGVDPRTLARDRQRDIQSQADKRSLMDRVRGR